MNQRVQGATVKSHKLYHFQSFSDLWKSQELDPLWFCCSVFPNSVSLGVAAQTRFGAAFSLWWRFRAGFGRSGAGSGLVAGGCVLGWFWEVPVRVPGWFQRSWCGFRAGYGRFRKCLTLFHCNFSSAFGVYFYIFFCATIQHTYIAIGSKWHVPCQGCNCFHIFQLTFLLGIPSSTWNRRTLEACWAPPVQFRSRNAAGRSLGPWGKHRAHLRWGA